MSRTSTYLRAGAALALVAGALALPTPALACAACACGVPSLTASGEEVAFAGRLRFSLASRAWGLTQAEGTDQETRLRELRLDVGVAYSPLSWLTVGAVLPMQARELRTSSLERLRAFAPGDAELSARATLLRDRALAPRNILSLLAGLKLPTAPRVHDEDGEALDLDAQVGTGSWDPMLGLAYAGFRGPFSLFASAVGRLPTRGRDDYRGPPALLMSAGAQYQPRTGPFAVRLATDAQLAGDASTEGLRDPSVNGLVGFISPDVLYSPTTDVLLSAGVRVPVVHATEEPVRFSPVFTLSLVVDR